MGIVGNHLQNGDSFPFKSLNAILKASDCSSRPNHLHSFSCNGHGTTSSREGTGSTLLMCSACAKAKRSLKDRIAHVRNLAEDIENNQFFIDKQGEVVSRSKITRLPLRLARDLIVRVRKANESNWQLQGMTFGRDDDEENEEVVEMGENEDDEEGGEDDDDDDNDEDEDEDISNGTMVVDGQSNNIQPGITPIY